LRISREEDLRVLKADLELINLNRRGMRLFYKFREILARLSEVRYYHFDMTHYLLIQLFGKNKNHDL